VRAPAVVLAALVALAAAAGAAAGAAGRDPRAPQQRHTARDTTFAKSIALRRSDLPAGWKAAPATKPAPPCSVEPDESKLVQTAQIDPTFVWKDGITTVGSEVDVFRTAAQAQTDWRLSTLALMRACLLETLRHAVGKQGRVTVVSAKALTPPKLGRRSLDYRLTFVLNGNASRALVAEIVGMNVGRTSVVLHALSVGGPLPAKDVRVLGSRLAARLAGSTGGLGGI
jgi:hypothetical protein